MNKINIDKVSDLDAIRAARQTDVYQVSKQNTQKAESTVPVAEDKVDFSSRAAEVGKLVDQVKQFPDVRQDLVSELRVQVSAGEYHPTNEEIATAILKDEGKN